MRAPSVRTSDGTYNDVSCPRMGSAGIRFGRNVPLNEAFPDTANLLNPSPRRVSLELLTRHTFQPATILNLLAVSLSTSDAVGHAFGPDSREVHDQHLRLDRWLGAFLDSLYRLRDSSRVLIALTSDHGVAPIPDDEPPATWAGQLLLTLQKRKEERWRKRRGSA